jgi:hypothetical protein
MYGKLTEQNDSVDIYTYISPAWFILRLFNNAVPNVVFLYPEDGSSLETSVTIYQTTRCHLHNEDRLHS